MKDNQPKSYLARYYNEHNFLIMDKNIFFDDYSHNL